MSSSIAERMFGQRDNVLREFVNTSGSFKKLFNDIKGRTKSSYVTNKCSVGEATVRKSQLNLLAIEEDSLTDIQFVELFKGTDTSMDWSLLFDQGTDLGHFSRYKNYQSLRSAYNKDNL
jgi:hypothetical protein